MKGIKLLLSFLLIGGMIICTALLSVQNAVSVSLRFGAWRSIELPLGLLLSFGFACGMALAVMLLLVWHFTALYSDLDEVSFADRSPLNQGSGDEEY
jgi:uncharacterized integral membrane protein